ncbi:MAG: FAD-dependent oxidoreductase [Pseudomonadota bacterium]
MTDQEQLIIVGAGHAAGQLAVSLRQAKYPGHITVLGDEAHPPYQRPPLSKAYLAGDLPAERLLLKPAKWYPENAVDMELETRVTAVATDTKTVSLATRTGELHTLPWDKLVLATGSRVRELTLPGNELPGVHYLRTVADVDQIREEFQGAKRLVVVGGGYIGLEVAAVARKHGLDVHVVEMMDRLLSRVVSPVLSEFYLRVHEDAGVQFHLQTGVSGFAGDDRVTGVLTDTGETLAADLVIVGVGIVPNTELAATAGIDCDNGIVVDEYCQTSHPDVLAIGDCTNHPNPLLDRRLRLESVPNALDQARTAAATLTGQRKPYAAVPWFWSDQYDLKLQIVGLTAGYDETVLRGSLDAKSFACFYLADGRLIAVDAVNSPREFMHSKPIVAQQLKIPVTVLEDPDASLKEAAETYADTALKR